MNEPVKVNAREAMTVRSVMTSTENARKWLGGKALKDECQVKSQLPRQSASKWVTVIRRSRFLTGCDQKSTNNFAESVIAWEASCQFNHFIMSNTKSIKSSTADGLSRRKFIKRTTLAAGAAALSFPYVGNVLGANDRINIACIGCGGKGDSDTNDARSLGGNIVALCDVDEKTLNKKAHQFADSFPDLKKYRDYRKLLDEMDKNIDAVTISVPDHNHGVAGIRSMKMGKHCFCQKPLTQTVSEARIMRQLAKEKNLATQMGNQGSAENGLRRAVEVIHAGVIGQAHELHVWSNRPIWPQGINRPEGSDPIPADLDWDLWLGPAHKRPFKKDVYHTFKWRGWFDFGTGALGDMACHTVNMPFRGLKMGYPNVVECELASRIYPESFPKTSRIRFEFPEREGLVPLKFWWYDGAPADALKPLRPPSDRVRAYRR